MITRLALTTILLLCLLSSSAAASCSGSADAGDKPAGQSSINGRDLVDWYCGTAARPGAQLHESTVSVETRGR